jgi:hypothetical protein
VALAGSVRGGRAARARVGKVGAVVGAGAAVGVGAVDRRARVRLHRQAVEAWARGKGRLGGIHIAAGRTGAGRIGVGRIGVLIGAPSVDRTAAGRIARVRTVAEGGPVVPGAVGRGIRAGGPTAGVGRAMVAARELVRGTAADRGAARKATADRARGSHQRLRLLREGLNSRTTRARAEMPARQA